MERAICPHCNEQLPATNDAFCTFCREPIELIREVDAEEAEFRMVMSETLNGWAFLIGSGLAGLVTAGIAISCVLRLVKPQETLSVADAAGRIVGSLVVGALLTGVSAIITYGLYCEGHSRLNPEE